MFIRHRTEDEIKEAEDTKWETLRDPQPDSDRVQKPEWLIMLGMSYHSFIAVSCKSIGYVAHRTRADMSFQVYVPIWDVSLSVRRVSLEDGFAPAMARIMTYQDGLGRDLHLST